MKHFNNFFVVFFSRFIAELFKLKMLTEGIMHGCIQKLLRSSDEDSLECLSGLLKNIGKELSNNMKAVRFIHIYYVTMHELCTFKFFITPHALGLLTTKLPTLHYPTRTVFSR